jgi:hypothetical protein
MSNDIKAVPASSKRLLQNKGLLAVNQDVLGRMGTRFSVELGSAVGTKGSGQGWRKDLANGDVAIVLFNPTESATNLAFPLTDAGFAPDTRVHAMDLLDGGDTGPGKGWIRGEYTTAKAIDPHGSVALRLSFVPRYPAPSQHEL